MPEPSVLIIEDDDAVRTALARSLQEAGCIVEASATAADAFERLEGFSPKLVLLDYRLPDADGLDVLARLRRQQPDLPVVMITGFAIPEIARQAMALGAYDYVSKPFSLEQMMFVVNKVLDLQRERSEVQPATSGAFEAFGFDRLVGRSPQMLDAVHLLQRLAVSEARTILLQGESGTGKDLAAKVIHYNSPRAERPFINITCTALPEALLESELFGHERGAFTDARQQKQGLFELATGGTIFLDEIGDMPAPLQAKLLRFLEEKAFRRVGGTKDIHVDVCIIAATNRVLRALVEQGEFRADLFYRLNIFPVTLPPIRDRPDDIPLLADHFIRHYNEEFHKNVTGVDRTAVALMQVYRWPGNVRELRNMIERAMLLARGGRLTVGDLPPELKAPTPSARPASPPPVDIDLGPEGLDIRDVERSLILKALERTGGNQSRAAALLRMTRDQLRYRVQKYGLRSAPKET